MTLVDENVKIFSFANMVVEGTEFTQAQVQEALGAANIGGIRAVLDLGEKEVELGTVLAARAGREAVFGDIQMPFVPQLEVVFNKDAKGRLVASPVRVKYKPEGSLIFISKAEPEKVEPPQEEPAENKAEIAPKAEEDTPEVKVEPKQKTKKIHKPE